MNASGTRLRSEIAHTRLRRAPTRSVTMPITGFSPICTSTFTDVSRPIVVMSRCNCRA